MSTPYTHLVQADGLLLDRTTNKASAIASVDAHLVVVDHLLPHITAYTLPRGGEIRALVRYSCHCWTEAFDATTYAGRCIFQDGVRQRAFDTSRFQKSLGLPDFIAGLQSHRCLMTPSKRNFMAYNATVKLADSSFYKVFFKVEKQRGALDSIRHSVVITVESAYATSDADEGMAVKFNAIVNSVLTDKPIKYKP